MTGVDHEINLDFLLDDLVDRVPDVTHAVAISSDGLILASSSGLPPDSRDQLAAIGSGLVSLLRGAARFFQAGRVVSNVTELDGGFMFSMAVSSGASLLALASSGCDLGQVGHQLAELINRIAPMLTPGQRPSALVTASTD